MIFFKRMKTCYVNLHILLLCSLNFMSFQRCLITSVAGLKKTKTFLMKQWWLHFGSHLTDSWQTFLKITSIPTVVSQTIFPHFSASEWNPCLLQYVKQSLLLSGDICVWSLWSGLSPHIDLSVLRLMVLQGNGAQSQIYLACSPPHCWSQLQREQQTMF